MNSYTSDAAHSLILKLSLLVPASEEEHDCMAQLLIEFGEPSHLGLSYAAIPDSYYQEQAESLLSDELLQEIISKLKLQEQWQLSAVEALSLKDLC